MMMPLEADAPLPMSGLIPHPVLTSRQIPSMKSLFGTLRSWDINLNPVLGGVALDKYFINRISANAYFLHSCCSRSRAGEE
jgi:hypothetical protein